jgi:hypothetical protein
MTTPTTEHEALRALAVMAGVLRYCPRHDLFYRGPEPVDAAMPLYDRHLDEVRRFFPTPVAFYTALKYARSQHQAMYCPECTRAVGFV